MTELISKPVRGAAGGLLATLVIMLLSAHGALAERFAPDAKSFTLDNGMQVVVIPDHRTPVVTHMVWYKVGSADEPEGKTGVAHFLEHLLFKGTPKYPKGAFSRLVAQRGGQENAFTSLDYTGYFQRVAKEHLPLVMELEADRMANLQLSEDEVASERNVVLEERRSRTDNEPSAQLREEVYAALYRSHPYGRPVIGWEHEIKALNRKDALEFYDTYYSPNNAVLVVAGDVTLEELRPLAEKFYGVLERRAEPGARNRPSEPPQRAARRIDLESPRVTQPSIRRYYAAPSLNTGEPADAYALEVLAQILGGGATSRLYRQLVVDGQTALSAGAWYDSTAVDGSQFGVYGVPRGEVSLEQLEAEIDAILADVVANGVTADEVEKAANTMIADAVYAQDSQSGMARVFGSGLTSGLTVEQIQNWPLDIAKVTPEQVKAAAAKYLDMASSVTGILTNPATARKAAGNEGSKKNDG